MYLVTCEHTNPILAKISVSNQQGHKDISAELHYSFRVKGKAIPVTGRGDP
jgi:hypothetical protein